MRCQLPKMHVVDLLSFSRFSNQDLALEPLIVFPIGLQIDPAGRRNPFQLAVVQVIFPVFRLYGFRDPY